MATSENSGEGICCYFYRYNYLNFVVHIHILIYY